MNWQDEAEIKVSIQNLYKVGGTSSVLDCLVSMLEAQIVVTKKLKDLLEHTGD